MTSRENHKRKLSKSILEMKFMKRTKEKFQQEQEDEEGRNMYSNEITDKMRHNKGSQYIEETSFAICEDLLIGRLSYKGMNPEIERILELEELEKAAKETPKDEADVTDKEMTKYYIDKTGQRGNNESRTYSKYNIKRKNTEQRNTPSKFLKPNYDNLYK
ncbi:M-phase phosphoprotein 6-like [Ctenocephalides felis]|uniref:M-phase phosphoprotein 6-like n=1 Tax=Ctenocephalides felis TaxID=7515 RepID=UPI000E6E416F|nr:M-phase phosphoprotein 6-like [Ctenocephalides felis]XP_026469900.1 M-phase phosphoprotein 6-like [Ctenocephalides felis]